MPKQKLESELTDEVLKLLNKMESICQKYTDRLSDDEIIIISNKVIAKLAKSSQEAFLEEGIK